MNAKELVLEKINAAGDLARIYIYMIATGNKFSDITNFMTKDIITFISNKSKRSVFKEEDEFTSLDSAIDYFLKGVNTNNYFEKDYKKNIFNELLKLVQDSKYKKLLEKENIDSLEELINNNSEVANFLYNEVKSNSTLFKESYISLNSTIADSIDDDVAETLIRGSKKNLKYKILRYLKECSVRASFIENSGEEILNDVNNLNTYNTLAKEFSQYTGLCGINQGLKTQREQFYSNIFRIEQYINKKIRARISKDSNSSLKGYKFDFIKFITNKGYQNFWINSYENELMDSINILDAVVHSPHFNMMYQALATSHTLLKAISFKYNKYEDIIRDLLRNNTISSLTKKEDRIVKKFINDLTLRDFFNNNEFIVYPENEEDEFEHYVDVKGTVVSNNDNINLNSPFGRASFKRLMERVIIPRLKAEYPNNEFIKSLILDYEDNRYSLTQFYKLPISLNNLDELDSFKFDEYVKSFNSIKDNVLYGNTIEDLFFAYNLLLNNNSFGPKAFTKVFTDSVKNPKESSLIAQYSKYESELPNKDLQYNIQDLNLRFIGYEGNLFKIDYDYKIKLGNKEIESLTIDNSLIFPFSDDLAFAYKDTANNLKSQLLDLLYKGQALIELTCDE